jgi:hypothetical protein
MTTLTTLTKYIFKNIGLTRSYSIYFNSSFNSLSIIYLHKFKFLYIYRKLQLGNKIDKI